MNELSSKLDRKDNSSQYKPRIHPGRNRGCMDKGRTDIVLEKGLIAEIEIHTIIAVETEEITKTKTIMVLEAREIGIEITKIIDPITEGKILTKIMAKDLDIGV